MNTANQLQNELSQHVWRAKYRHQGETDIRDTWRRVAAAVASVEGKDRAMWETRFHDLLKGFRFLPGGRILAGAGTGQHVTLMNCFVMGTLDDSIEGIFNALREGALTMQQGGGIGYDFSTLRPAGEIARASGSVASGPVSFMRIWDTMCGTLLSTGARRGAMMATLRCDHPDIMEFIDVKRDPKALRNFNLSVQITDAFMAAVRENDLWSLVFPISEGEQEAGSEIVTRHWSNQNETISCKVVKKISARELWDRLIRSAYDVAEPGVLFTDTIARENNLSYCESLTATNPCGEIPLSPYGVCNLGSLNLTQFTRAPFQSDASIDYSALENCAAVATRFLDNVIDLSRYPLDQQHEQAHKTRRIGLGITGLGDALAMLGHHYDSEAAREVAGETMRRICESAYRASISLAAERSAFPALIADKYLASGFAKRLPQDIRDAISKRGIRNSHLTAIAPTGTISLLANNVSSGIEPIFALHGKRRVLAEDGSYREFGTDDFAASLYQEEFTDQPLPETIVESHALTAEAHLAMQAALQPFVDNAISKTVNVPLELPFESFRGLYREAWEKGLKGCTAFRPNPVTGSILERDAVPFCCNIEREAD